MKTHKKNMVEHSVKKRGSEYIGISRNGAQWQVSMIMATRKNYICTVNNQEIAAILNDFVSIQHKGKSAKTNFNYLGKHLGALMEMKDILSFFN